MSEQGHPIEVDLERILPILAREIYTSPFAFLRENVQNAFDAIRMQIFRERSTGMTREHGIYITLNGNKVSISDSGIGMTKQDLASLFWSIKFQLVDRLRRQFLIDGVHVRAGELSHGAMLWTSPSQNARERVLFVDFRHPHIKRLVGLRESLSFDAVFDIFIRDSVLPHLEGEFPDLRKRDFDALLRKLQSTVEYFEIDPGDVGRIQQLASNTNMSPEAVATVFGGRRASTPRSTSVGRGDMVSVGGRVNKVAEQAHGKSLDEIRREMDIVLLETALDAKILDATEVKPEFGLARYYLSLTADAHVLYRRVFLERKPSTDFSWGGHRGGYLFYSQGSAVVYYDIQFEELVGESEQHERTACSRCNMNRSS